MAGFGKGEKPMASKETVLATAQVALIMMLALMGAIAAISLVDYAMAPDEYRFGTPVTGWQRSSAAVFVATNGLSVAALIAGALLMRSPIARRPRTLALCALAVLSLISFG